VSAKVDTSTARIVDQDVANASPVGDGGSKARDIVALDHVASLHEHLAGSEFHC